MLDIFFEYISERPFLMTEFPMNNWRNNVDYVDDVDDVDDARTLADNCVVIDEGCAENNERHNVDLDDEPVLPVDNDGCSKKDSENVLTENPGDGCGIQSRLNGFISSPPSPTNIELNDSC